LSRSNALLVYKIFIEKLFIITQVQPVNAAHV